MRVSKKKITNATEVFLAYAAHKGLGAGIG